MKNKRHNTSLPQRWGIRALTLLLACALMAGLALTASARGDWQGEVVDPATPKPVVTIQGNLVTEKGKPTGFYELALCVRSGRTITDPTGVTGVTPGSVVTEADFAAYLAANPDVAEDPTTVFDIQYYPFRTATAAMHVNTDILTAVNWNLASVTYETFDAATGSYPSDALVTPGVANYPRGIDTDPAVQGYDPALLPETDAFPDITTPNLGLTDPLKASASVALDVENDPRMSTAEGVAEHWDNNDALITLSASAPDNYSVILKDSTPLVVARFAYDLKRFDTTKVSTALGTGTTAAQRNSITGDAAPGAKGLWMGWDKTSGYGDANFSGKEALTWLGQSSGTFDFTNSDEQAAATQADQAVWVHTGTLDASAPDTFYYYYLAAETDPAADTGTVNIYDKTTGGVQEVKNVALPDTVGFKVLTQGTDRNPAATPMADYTYFRNLLSLGEQTLVVKLVNEPTFKRPANANGNIILFYDWDDTLIGSLSVGKGDVRAEVEAYIEENLVHPDLRPGATFMDDGAGNTDLGKVTSLQRDYTYRGKYAYTVGGDDAALGVTDGKEYPLTNKLDYVFTKRVNTVLTQEENGSKVQYVHPYALNDPALDPTVRDNDAAEYPYVYGWAVVEDTRAFNGNKDATVTGTKGPWKTMHDAAKLEDTWTTIGVGELTNSKPANALQSVAAVDPAAERTAPVFLADADPAWTDGTLGDDYAYTISGENSYLRFADFSDITAELERYEGKDTLIVKAVYEPGASLLDGYTYTAVTKPAYTKWNNVAASAGGAYRVQMTVERSYEENGQIRGTTRIRMPAIQQDTTIDYKWLSDPDKGVNNDLNNATFAVSMSKDETIYTQVDSDNGELITFSLALSSRQNRVDYVLVERYGANFVAGTQRSTTNNDKKGDPVMFIPDNYNYLAGDDSDIFDDLYDSDFATKDGSHGFVLYGTLGHFLEQATKCNNGEITRASYDSVITFRIAPDANLRMDVAGNQPTATSNTILREAFLAAALRCEAHKNDPAYDCWDENLDCAKLTYHQAQWFLLDYQANAGADILPAATAEGQKLTFCHYHVSCSGGHVPVAPTTWQELVETLRKYNDAAPGSDDQNNAMADLEVLDVATLENLTSLRSNANGRKYSNLEAFINALLAADAQLKDAGVDASWVNLQYVILHGAPADADTMWEEGQERYWWYAGATSAPKVNDFTALLGAAETARNPVTLKDGDDTFLPKSALTAATFLANSAEYLTAASPSRSQRTAWVNLTNNLVPSHAETLVDPDGTPDSGDETVEYTYGRFPDMDTFLDLFTAAYGDIIDEADAAGEDPPADNDTWWEALQVKLLPDGDNLGDHDGTGDRKFWWKGGQTPFRITNLSTLIECVRRMGDRSDVDAYVAALNEWDRITVTEIESVSISQSLRWKGNDPAHPMYPHTGADLAADEAGQKNAILTQLQSVVSRLDAAMAADSTVRLNWNNVQYLLLNAGALPVGNAVYDQSTYYWWKDGNTTGTAVTLVPNATGAAVNDNIQVLIGATYRADFNDPGVISSILAATTSQDNSFWSFTKLIATKVQGTTFPRADAPVDPNANDTYDGPDVLDDVKAAAYPAANESDVRAFLTMLTQFRDAAKADPDQGTSDPYGMPDYNWQEVQYFCLTNTFLPYSDPIIKDLRDQDKALAGDYWWYYADQRVPPEPPRPDVPDPPPNPAVGLVNDLINIRDTSEDPATDLDAYGYTLTPDMFASWGIFQLDGNPISEAEIEALQSAMMGLFDELDAYGLALEDLTWPQLQVLFGTCGRDWWWTVTSTEEEALDYLVNSEGAMLVADGGYIPDEYAQIYPEIFGLAFSLRSADVADQPADLSDLGELVEDGPDTTSLDDLLAQKAELERQLAELEKQIEAARGADKETDEKVEDDASSSPDGGRGESPAPTEPNEPLLEDPDMDTATPETPMGEEAGDVGAAVPGGPEELPQSPAATAPSTEGAPGDGNTSQASPEPPSDEGGVTGQGPVTEGEMWATPVPGGPDGPSAEDPDMTTATPETPVGEEAGTWNVPRLSTLPRRYAPPPVEAVWKKWWVV